MGIIHSFPRESAFIVKFTVGQREKLSVSASASGPIHYTLTWLAELSPSGDLYSLNLNLPVSHGLHPIKDGLCPSFHISPFVLLEFHFT